MRHLASSTTLYVLLWVAYAVALGLMLVVGPTALAVLTLTSTAALGHVVIRLRLLLAAERADYAEIATASLRGEQVAA